MTELVGRTADRDQLRAVLRQLREGLSAVLVVSGDAGIGKTRLLQWAAASCEATDLPKQRGASLTPVADLDRWRRDPFQRSK